jgi:Ca-activated chloride channel family protein
MDRYLLRAVLAGSAFACLPLIQAAPPAAAGVSEGSLIRVNRTGETAGVCPLKHTDVRAEIAGFIGRVTVTQEFVNPSTEKIEAVYKFPLPPDSAVDDMRMLVGDRTVLGKIKRREEARAIYETARASGRIAALLDQERPNVFTQSVANILAGQTVKVTISYTQLIKYDNGAYEFSFPMVVGPRYIPQDWAQRVPDAPNIVPLRTPEGTRAGHDLSLAVELDAGMPIQRLESPTHAINVERRNPDRAAVRLRDLATIPNKDFILRYAVADQQIGDAVLTHADARGGYFTLLLQPPARVAASAITPKEIVFVLDTSGSMMGFPIEKAKEAMRGAIGSLNPGDTFNLITFSGDTHILFPQPVLATPDNIRKADEFLLAREGRGGTEMMKAIRTALEPSDNQDHIRVVCFMTDGEVGNDLEIIGEVKKHPNARVFSFGVGSSVNHFLLDNMARYGRGDVEYVGLNDDGSAAARRFYERVRTPVLTDISIDWAGLPVSQIYPKHIPDLFSAKPVIVTGRYTGSGKASIRLRGRIAGRDFERRIDVDLPALSPRHAVLATLWARAKVDDLMSEDMLGMQRGAMRADLRENITQLGLEYKLMTQYTSFVAVEETTITEGGQPKRVEVPVEMPEGVSYEGIYGREQRAAPMGYSGSLVPRKLAVAAVAQAPVAGPAMVDRTSMDNAPLSNPRLKVDPSLLTLSVAECTVRVFLTDAKPETLAKLKAIGFKVIAQPKSASIAVGRIATHKLMDLAAITEVRYIAPYHK